MIVHEKKQESDEDTAATTVARSAGFCFIHIDCDSYSSHIETMTALYDRLVLGGIIVFDEYHSEEWPGATSAVDEFLIDGLQPVQQSRVRTNPAWYMIKST